MKIKVKMTRSENTAYYKCASGDVVAIDFDEYLKGVVPSEIGNVGIEACKAQAIASRTYAWAAAIKGSIISDQSSSAQAYRVSKADSKVYPNAVRAVDETLGMVLKYGGTVINSCPYSASNGGRTTSSAERWGGVRAWLVSKDDPWDMALSQGKKTGHGVGMSQTGARYAAGLGKTYEEILRFYYNGCEIVKKYGGENAMNDKAKALCEWAVSKKGCGYVWGATGQVMTQSVLEQ